MASRSASAWRALLYQALAVLSLLALGLYLGHNLQANMAARGIQSGWAFLADSAGFDIGESLFPFDASQPYWQAFLVGLANTLRVVLPAILLCTVAGTLLGIGRLIRHPLLRALSATYVEVFRNIPLLLQLLLWYLLLTEVLPDSQHALHWGSVFLSKAGLSFPAVQFSQSHWQADWPVQGEFGVEGGAALSPEFLALCGGLSLYTAAFIAELVRAGLLSVPRGQIEAAQALGLSRPQTLRHIALPQALRAIIPPLTNQYLNLLKNSSLAVAIGYPDLVSVTNTAINQTGRAVECIAIVIFIYASVSLLAAALMHRFNQRYANRTR